MRVTDIVSIHRVNGVVGAPDIATLPSVRIGFTIFSERRRQQRGIELRTPGMDDEHE